MLRELIGDCDIEELPISLTAVATDLDSGQEVWLRSGKLFDAIRASMAAPMALDDVTDLTIAVDLSGPSEATLCHR